MADGRASRPIGRLLICVLAVLLLAPVAAKATPQKTLVQDVLYRADGGVAHGTITVRWNGFTTAAGEAVPAGVLTVAIATDGSIAIPLIPNAGATPSGNYYRIVIKLDDGTASEETWVVPSVTSATVAEIRANVVPQTVAAQFATTEYVDAAVAGGMGPGADLSSPGPIGDTTPNTGDFTTLQSDNSITKVSPAVDIRSYGAVCDGSTNDQAALQSAITAVGAGGGVILVPGIGSGCYIADPASISWPSYTKTLLIRLQGKLITGSTFKLPNYVDIVGEGGAAGTQFAAGGPVAKIEGPTSAPTLGTACTADVSCEFTPSSMTGISTGGAVTVAGQTTCTISSIVRASNTVTATLSGACHVPPGFNATIASVTDSSFNGSFEVAFADYALNTIGWKQTAGDASSSGGTLTGYDEDTIETAVITATTGTTATATFTHDHTSSDKVGVVGVYLTGFLHHALRNLSVSSSGTAIWAYLASQIHLDNVSAQAFNPWGGALEFNESFWNYVSNSAFPNYAGATSWAIRFTNIDLA